MSEDKERPTAPADEAEPQPPAETPDAAPPSEAVGAEPAETPPTRAETPPETADTPPDRAAPPPPAVPPQVAVVNPSAPRRGGALAALALLLALAAAGGTGYLWWLMQQQGEVAAPMLPDLPDVGAEVEKQARPLRAAIDELREQVAQDLGQVRRTLADVRGEVESDVAEVQRETERLAAGRDGVDRVLAKVEDDIRRGLQGVERRLVNLETGLAALADSRSSTTAELALAETEFLLRSASERLQLMNDPRGAQTALNLAQSRLDGIDDPVYASVRQTVAGHIEALRQVELPDRVALSGRLLALARNSVEWPLDARRSLQASGANLLTPSDRDSGWWPRFKEVLSSVVVVHREKEAEAVLLTLEEERLLRENVRLQLQVAQLAAVRGEQPLYEAAIDAVSDWLGDYFDQESALVTGALEQLEELRAIDLNPPLPDISAALRQLRSVRAAGALAAGAERLP